MRDEEDPAAQAIAAARQALGQQLAALRRAAGYGQRDFAPLTGYQRGTVANVETGRQNAPRVFWERCAQALGADVLVAGYDQIQGMVAVDRQEAARRAQAIRDAKIRVWQDARHVHTTSHAGQLVALPANRQADEIHIWLSSPDGSFAHHMIVPRDGVTVSKLAAVLCKLLQPDGSETEDQER
jgi:transcriptional regulator with XRE-family HTH domain